VTIALEHFTAMFAHEFLEHPQHFVGADVEQAELWRWHAVEELEHKGVAYDTWLHATRGWSRWKRWKVKSLLMLVITRRFIRTASATRAPARAGRHHRLARQGAARLVPRRQARHPAPGLPGVVRLFPSRLPPVEPRRPALIALRRERGRLMFAHRITIEPSTSTTWARQQRGLLRWVQDA
jgi:hypothetical protein